MIQTALITHGVETQALQNAEVYKAAVDAHLGGDWSAHLQIFVVDEVWTDSAGYSIPGSKKLRFSVTKGGVTTSLEVPIIPVI